MKIQYFMWGVFFLVRDSTDVHSTIHICALLVFAQCEHCAFAQKETQCHYICHIIKGNFTDIC